MPCSTVLYSSSQFRPTHLEGRWPWRSCTSLGQFKTCNSVSDATCFASTTVKRETSEHNPAPERFAFTSMRRGTLQPDSEFEAIDSSFCQNVLSKFEAYCSTRVQTLNLLLRRNENLEFSWNSCSHAKSTSVFRKNSTSIRRDYTCFLLHNTISRCHFLRRLRPLPLSVIPSHWKFAYEMRQLCWKCWSFAGPVHPFLKVTCSLVSTWVTWPILPTRWEWAPMGFSEFNYERKKQAFRRAAPLKNCRRLKAPSPLDASCCLC